MLPALGAAAFAAATAAAGRIPHARKIALRDSLEGSAQRALTRYIEHGQTIESRWLTLRVLGIATSAILAGRHLPESIGAWEPLAAAFVALLAYGIPAEIGIVVAERMAERSAPLLIRVLRPLELAVAPIAAPIAFLGRAVAGAVPKAPKNAEVTETEVELLVNEGEMNGSLEHDQSEMIRNVLDFGDLTAGNVMIPRTQVTLFELATPIEEVLKIVNEKGHSRYPVYDDSVDNVVGILHVKDLISYAAVHDLKDVSLDDIVRKPVVFVPTGQSASSVLQDMRAGRRQHIAVVIDEFGGVSGIVTLEDLIEEIVGDIRDEHDREDAPIVDLGDGHLMVDATVSIADLSRYLGADLPEDASYNSLGGFIVAQVGAVPKVGDRVKAYDLEFLVQAADERHVSRVEIIRPPPTSDSIAPSTTRNSGVSAA